MAGDQLWDFETELHDALAAAGASYETVSQVGTFAGEGELRLEGGAVPIHLRGYNMVLRRTDSGDPKTERLQVIDFTSGGRSSGYGLLQIHYRL